MQYRKSGGYVVMRTFIGGVHRRHGIFTHAFNGFGANKNSAVTASICEMDGTGQNTHIGAAAMRILGVAPAPDGTGADTVHVKVHIDWGEDLNFRMTLFIDP